MHLRVNRKCCVLCVLLPISALDGWGVLCNILHLRLLLPQTLQAQNLMWAPAYVTVSMFFINIGFNALFIANWGFTGAAYAQSASRIAQFLLLVGAGPMLHPRCLPCCSTWSPFYCVHHEFLSGHFVSPAHPMPTSSCSASSCSEGTLTPSGPCQGCWWGSTSLLPGGS